MHATAVIHPGARLGRGVRIGPYSVVGEHVELGEGTSVGPHAVLEGWTRIGKGCEIGVGALIGAAPQDRKYAGARSWVRIGDRNVIREYVTVHRAADADGATVIGDDNYIMAFAHVAHNCAVGSFVTVANAAGLAGHVEIGDHAVIGGMAAFHQFTRVGAHAIVGGTARVRMDIVPYAMAMGEPLRIYGLNRVGLRRSGFSAESQATLKAAFRTLFWSGLNVSDAVARLKAEHGGREEVARLVSFAESSKRGLTPGIRVGEGADGEEP